MPTIRSLLHKSSQNGRVCTGFDELDEAFARAHGLNARGIPKYGFTEISGPPGSGKSQISLFLALDAMKSGYKVLWVSCSYRPFPLPRLKQMKGFSPTYLKQLRVLFLEKLEALFVLDAPGFDVVVFDHYDSVVTPYDGDPGLRIRETTAVVEHLKTLARTKCVLCTSTVLPRKKYREDEHKLITPALWGVPAFRDIPRIMIYRDFYGTISTTLGVQISIERDGIVPPTTSGGFSSNLRAPEEYDYYDYTIDGDDTLTSTSTGCCSSPSPLSQFQPDVTFGSQ